MIQCVFAAGASDTTITLWDIGTPTGEKYDTQAKYACSSTVSYE